MTKPIRRVAVIGAGPAGAIATDALVKEQSFEKVRVFDRRHIPGGTWVYTPDLQQQIPSLRDLIGNNIDQPVEIPTQFPCKTPRDEVLNGYQRRFSDSAVHDTLHSNLPPSTMCFTQEPLPEILSKQTLARYGPGAPFRHRSVVRDWVEKIFTRGGHDKLVEFNTTVEKAEKQDDKWILTLRKESPGQKTDYWWQESFDAVVVASGHYNIPYIPNIPGLAEYEDRYPGTIRHSKHFGLASAYQDKKVIVVGGSVSAFDALHDIRLVSKSPVISSLQKPLPAFGWAPFTHPDIEVRPPIVRVDPDNKVVEFADGHTVTEIDIILFATGYDFSFPFLSDINIRHRRISGLYQHVFKIDDPTLAFIGMVSGGLTFRVFEWQAVATARLFAGRASLPSQAEMDKWEEERVANTGDGVAFFSIAPDFKQYFETLRQIAGQPGKGTTGRVLPVFERWWEDEFLKVIEARTAWWDKEMRKAQQALS